jgi:sporulation protein YlmC with PRC-barrel domain
LVSVTGLIGRSVYDRRGNRVGRVHDLVIALGNGDHPPLHGILVRARREVVFIPYTAMAGILRWEVYLTTSVLQPHPRQLGTGSKGQRTENTVGPTARG